MSEHELWNELGNLYFMSAAYNQAIYAYHRSIQLEKRFGRPYSNLALTYVRQGKYAEAVELYRMGIELLADDKEKAISWYRLGDVYRCLKDYRDAILAYQQGDLLDPTLSQDGDEIGQVLYGASGLTSPSDRDQTGMAEEGPSNTKLPASDSLEPDPISPAWVTRTQIQQPEPGLAEAESTPVSETSVSIQETGEPDPAFEEDCLPDPEEEEPGDWHFYFESKDPDMAAAKAESDDLSGQGSMALVPIPNPIPAALNSNSLSRTLSEGIQTETLARVDFQDVAVVETNDPLPVVFSTTSVQESQPDIVEEEKVAAAPDQQAVAENFVVAPDEPELEIEKSQRLLETEPYNAAAWESLGDLYKSVGKYKEAIFAYQQAVSNNPKNIQYRHRLGMMYAIEGRDEEAVETFKEILKLNPGHGLTNATLGGYYRKMGLKELAQKHIDIAMKNIYDSENEYNQACLQALCGNANEALKLLRIALESKQTYVDWVLRDPDLDGIRSEPGFKQLISDFM